MQIAAMTTNAEPLPRRRHHGRNMKTLREMLGMKQDTLALELNVSQQTVSNMEGKEQLDDEMIGKVASALGIQPELIKNFVPEEAIYNIQNNYEGTSNNTNIENYNHQCTFNPLDKYVEAMEENRKLYERLLQAEKEKNEMLKQLLQTKK